MAVYVFAHHNTWYLTVYQDLGVTDVTLANMVEDRVQRLRDGMGPGCEMKPILGPVTVKLSINSHMLDVEVKQGKNVYSCVEKEHI